MQITKEEFAKLYYSLTNKEICEKLNISLVSLYRTVNQLKLKKKRKPKRKLNKLEIV